MPLLVGQIVYTSFPAVGFKYVASQEMSLDVQQTFVQQVVHPNWDNYNPPNRGYKAAFLYQFSPDRCLFGWLYNEGNDDLGRANIPYCIGYYLTGLLSTVQLENILTCLSMGPVTIVDRDRPPIFLDSVIIPDLCNYQPARSGVPIASELRKQTHKQLLQKKLLNLFVGVNDLQKIYPHERHSTNSSSERLALGGSKSETDSEMTIPVEAISSMGSQLELPSQPYLNPLKIEQILQTLMAKPIGIKGLALVSAEGQPILSPIGIDRNSTLIMAGSMLYLAKNTQDEFQWHNIENVTVRASEGYVILVSCQSDVFLLIKAGKALSGLLEGEINRTIEKLKAALQTIQTTENSSPEKRSDVIAVTPEVLPKIEEVLHEFHTETPLASEDEIRYRGRRMNL